MATRRRDGKGRAGKRPDGKARGGVGTAGKRPSGVRRTRETEAARELEQPTWPAPDELVEGPERPQLRLAEPSRGERLDLSGKSAAARHAEADREAAEIARRIEERAGAAAASFRRRTEAASGELRRRREEREARGEQAELEIPGLGAIALALLRGALRLIRAMATAPLRIGLALLWPREA